MHWNQFCYILYQTQFPFFFFTHTVYMCVWKMWSVYDHYAALYRLLHFLLFSFSLLKKEEVNDKVDKDT